MASQVDPGLVGTWEMMVPNAKGVARWVWDIHAEGSYDFHAEGPGNVPAHSGSFSAKDGQYTLQSNTLAWADSGTYQLIQGNTLQAVGRLGAGSWQRVQQDSANARKFYDGTATGTDDPSQVFPPAEIYSVLSKQPFGPNLLPPAFNSPSTEGVELDAQARQAGVVGVVKTQVQGPSGPAAISFQIYRDRTVAEAAYAEHAVFDSPAFHSEPGEMVSSHARSVGIYGDARCLSRVTAHSASPASVKCYLLIQHPSREAVMIVGALRERIEGSDPNASRGAMDEATDLVLAGTKQWEASVPLMMHAALTRLAPIKPRRSRALPLALAVLVAASIATVLLRRRRQARLPRHP
jgi:hypothetical protein